jgi:hypothetical protein
MKCREHFNIRNGFQCKSYNILSYKFCMLCSEPGALTIMLVILIYNLKIIATYANVSGMEEG